MPTIPIRPTAPPSRPAAPADMRWRFARLASAPHRLGFFFAAVAMAATALWWAALIAAPWLGLAPRWAVPPAVAHGLAMSIGFMPLFIVGFLFTAGPKWLAVDDVPAPLLLRPVLAYAAGVVVLLAGVHVAAPLAAAGLLLAASAWVALVARFVRLLRASPVADRLHAGGVAVASGIGALAMVAGATGLVLGAHDLARAAVQLALWGFLAPVFAIVSHRMIPFFTASAMPALEAWRPNALLHAMLVALAATGAFEIADVLAWPLPPAAHAAAALLQAPAAVALVWLAVRWGLVQSLKLRLLAMLHGGFLWLGLAFALDAVSHALVAFAGEPASIRLAALHALTMGYLGATLIAMITRVAAGHSGRPLAADDIAWALYLLLQTAVLLRVTAAVWPAAAPLATIAAALAWAVACGGWAWRYGGWLGRPRVDGRPG